MELPEDTVYDIFSRLPAKSILKFKSCCKTINRFMKEKKFILKHIQNLTPQGGDSSYFIQGYNDRKIKIFALPRNKASSSSSSSSGIIPKRFLQFLNKRSGKILWSSNGLLFCEFFPKRGLFFWQKEFIICNPTTQTFSSIVAPPSLLQDDPHAYVSMAFDQNQNQYQLLLFEYSQHQEWEYVICKTYMPEEGVWKEREKDLLLSYSWMLLPSYFGGRHRYMLLYNFEDGKIRRVLFPKEVTESLTKFDYHDMFTFKRDKVGASSDDDYLVIWNKDSLIFTFWVLKDYQSSSWSMFLTLSFEDMGLKKDFIILGFTVINRDSLVFATRRDLYKYNLTGERGNKAEKIGEHNFSGSLNFVSFSNTLCSCGVDAKSLAFLL